MISKMYRKYSQISVNVADLRTCGVCHERPLFFSSESLNEHNLKYHSNRDVEERLQNQQIQLDDVQQQLKRLTSILLIGNVQSKDENETENKIKDLLESKQQLEEEYYDINEELDVLIQMGSAKQRSINMRKQTLQVISSDIDLKTKEIEVLYKEKMDLTTKIGERNKRTVSKKGCLVHTKRTLENEAINNINAEVQCEISMLLSSLQKCTKVMENLPNSAQGCRHDDRWMENHLGDVNHKLILLQNSVNELQERKMNEELSISAAQDVEYRYKHKMRVVRKELEKKDAELNSCKKTIKSLEERLELQENELEKVKDEMLHEQHVNKEYRLRIDSLQEKEGKLEHTNSKQLKQIEKLEEKIEVAKNTLHSQNQKLIDANNCEQIYKELIENKEIEIRESQTVIDSITSNLKTLEIENVFKTKEIEIMHQTIADKVEKVEKLKTDFTDAFQHSKQLKDSFSSEHQIAIDSMKCELKIVELESSNKARKIENLRQIISEKEESSEKMTKKFHESIKKQRQLKAEATAEHDKQHEEYLASFENLNNELIEQTSRKKEAQQKMDELQHDLTNSNASISELTSECVLLQEKDSRLNLECEVLRKKQKESFDKSHSLEECNKRLELSVVEMERRMENHLNAIKTAEREKEQMVHEIANLEQEKNNILFQNDELKKHCHEMEKAATEAVGKIKEKEAQLCELNSALEKAKKIMQLRQNGETREFNEKRET